MSKEESSLEEFKEKYAEEAKKHKLPDFDILNRDFELEIIATEESDFLVRRVRRLMVEKIYSIFIKLEAFINPQNNSLFVFNIVSGFDADDKELINKLYKQLAKYEIESFGLESKYSEQAEVDFIKKVTRDWPEVTKKLGKIHKSMEKNYDKETKKQSKSYFG